MDVFWKICLVVTLALCSQVFAQNKKMGLLGGWRDADENDESVQKALQFAQEEYNQYSNNGYITKIVRIIRLRKQVVSGMKYAMEVEALVSPNSGNESNLEKYQNQNAVKKRCSFEVLFVPWKNIRELRSSSCKNIA